MLMKLEKELVNLANTPWAAGAGREAASFLNNRADPVDFFVVVVVGLGMVELCELSCRGAVRAN